MEYTGTLYNRNAEKPEGRAGGSASAADSGLPSFHAENHQAGDDDQSADDGG